MCSNLTAVTTTICAHIQDKTYPLAQKDRFFPVIGPPQVARTLSAGVDSHPTVAVEGDDLVWLRIGACHSRRAYGHAWYAQSRQGWLIFQENLDKVGRNVTLYDVALNQRSVARIKGPRNTVFFLDCHKPGCRKIF